MRYEIGIGTGFDRDGVALNPADVNLLITAVLRRASEVFGGCNVVFGQGAWFNGTETVIEPSATFILDTESSNSSRLAAVDEEAVRRFAEHVGQQFNQAAVHFVRLVGVATNDAIAIQN